MRDPNENSPEAHRHRISRRTFLRGVGVTMALPWLESIPVWGGTVPTTSAAAATTASSALQRPFAVMFMGTEITGNHWWPKGNGEAMKLSKSLAPLEPIKKKINVING